MPGASFLYSSSVPSSTGVVEGGISEEPSGASETRNVIDVAHYRHPAAPFLPPTPSPECNWFDKAPSAGCTRRGTGGSSADPPKNQPKHQWNNPPERIRRSNPPEWIRRNGSAGIDPRTTHFTRPQATELMFSHQKNCGVVNLAACVSVNQFREEIKEEAIDFSTEKSVPPDGSAT